MACLDCDDCRKVKQKLYVCGNDGDGFCYSFYLGKINVNGYDPVITTDPIQYRIRLTKQNGTVLNIFQETTDVLDYLVSLCSDAFPDGTWANQFSGLVKCEILSVGPDVLDGTEFEMIDPLGATATCLLLDFSGGRDVSFGDVSIVCTYL